MTGSGERGRPCTPYRQKTGESEALLSLVCGQLTVTFAPTVPRSETADPTQPLRENTAKG